MRSLTRVPLDAEFLQCSETGQGREVAHLRVVEVEPLQSNDTGERPLFLHLRKWSRSISNAARLARGLRSLTRVLLMSRDFQRGEANQRRVVAHWRVFEVKKLQPCEASREAHRPSLACFRCQETPMQREKAQEGREGALTCVPVEILSSHNAVRPPRGVRSLTWVWSRCSVRNSVRSAQGREVAHLRVVEL